MIWESLDQSILKNSQYIRSEITKTSHCLAYSNAIRRNLRFSFNENDAVLDSIPGWKVTTATDSDIM